jgi:hypothetical protein
MRPSNLLTDQGQVAGRAYADGNGDLQIQRLGYTGDAATVTRSITIGADAVHIDGVALDVSQPADTQVLTYDAAAQKIRFKPAAAGGGGTVAYGTSLPASPTDGQEAILVDSITNPTYQWRFRYNAGSSSAYKWEFIGGAPAMSAVDTSQAANFNGTWGDFATVGPAITVPRAGDYDYHFVINGLGSGSSDNYNVGVALGAGTPAKQYISYLPNGSQSLVLSGEARLTALAASQELRLRYLNGNATITIKNRTLKVWPVRVA